MANRLAHSTSPYLLQHADNPVDWWEWGEEAFAEARQREVPILLSVGYSACHWCHVMAHESFEDNATAAYMNEKFVNIKVDREERPDVDAIYMKSTQAMTGQGGWPMTCVLTPDGEPFFAGTYFPPEPRSGLPAFTQVLQALADAWQNDRNQVTEVGEQVREFLSQASDPGAPVPTASGLSQSVHQLTQMFDEQAGGYGAAPKFPPSMVLEFALRYFDRTGDEAALHQVEKTLEAMARGGIYDQLDGGFARYSVDRFWRVPHFEKMLYDNAMLLRLYTHWWRATGNELARRIALETAEFIVGSWTNKQGAFAAAFDADTDGAEGTYYVWNREQLESILGPEDADWAAALFSVTAEGTFEHGLSTLQLLHDPDDQERYERVRGLLREARNSRTLPARDDKVVAAWNGLAITALAETGVLFKRPDLVEAAVAAGNYLVDVHLTGPFVRTSRDGVRSQHAAVLEDYGAVAEGFLALLGVTGELRWAQHATELLDTVLDEFADPAGGFFDGSADDTSLLVRPKDVSDNASPAGNSAVAHALLALSAITGESRYRATAESAVSAGAGVAAQSPRFAGWTLAAAEAMLAGPLEIAVVGPEPQRQELARAAHAVTSPGAVVVAADAGLELPLFEQRGLIDGLPAAYVCQGFVCRRPVTDPAALCDVAGDTAGL